VTRVFQLTAISLGAWAVLLICALLNVLPYRPHTGSGWLLFIICGPAVMLLLECLGIRVLASSLISRRSSPIRVLLGVLIFAAIGATTFLSVVKALGP
jgi:hypothetical protein